MNNSEGQTQEPVKCNGNCGMNYCDEYGCIENKPEGDVSHLLTPPPAPIKTEGEDEKRSFLDVLIENYQAQIAGFYNYDKTDAERAKRNAVIEEYQDLIAIFKSRNSASLPQSSTEEEKDIWNEVGSFILRSEDFEFTDSRMNELLSTYKIYKR